MKTSVRNKKFTVGIVLFLVIILILSILSAYYLNNLSKKTSAIHTENHVSVVFARDMSEDLTIINQEIVNCLLLNKNPDTLNINKKFKLFEQTLELEKNNITEIGEDALVAEIEASFNDYRDSVTNFIQSPNEVANYFFLLKQYDNLYKQMKLLSQLNEKAIEEKTKDAKVSANNASIQMSLIAAICFLIAYGFTFSFSSYFNDRFFKLYNGIKEVVSSNYSQRVNFDGKDELSEISLIFNRMADKIDENNKKTKATLLIESEKVLNINDIQELKEILVNIKAIEAQAVACISKFENK